MPCYNQGTYLATSVGSVHGQTFQDFEIIIVNDGSTDPETNRVLAAFQAPKARIIHSKNQGVSAARNLGIGDARGTYILTLDCDDKIAPTYLAQAVALLDRDPRLGIVYCKSEYFGFQVGPWMLPVYSFPDCIIHPAIFCAALYRRTDWQECGGYSVELKDGYEDHDFWLHLIKRGRKVHCLDETLFFYRRRPNSVTQALNLDKQVAAFTTIVRHHEDLFLENIDVLMRRLFALESHAQANSNWPIVQLFVDSGRGYNEFESIRSQYPAGEWVVIDLPLPPTTHYSHRAIRLDPGMQSGFYDISELTLVQANAAESSLFLGGSTPASLIRAEGTALLLPSHGQVRVFSYGSDPQLLVSGLNLPTEAGSMIRMKIRYQPAIEAAADSFQEMQVQADNDRPILQLFADTGGGYNEADSVRMRYATGEWVVVDVPLPKGASAHRNPLRLDPGMRVGCYDIAELVLLSAGKSGTPFALGSNPPASIVEVAGTSSVLPSQGCLRILSHGTDPQLLLNGLVFTEGADVLRVKIRFHSSFETMADSLSPLVHLGKMSSAKNQAEPPPDIVLPRTAESSS